MHTCALTYAPGIRAKKYGTSLRYRSGHPSLAPTSMFRFRECVRSAFRCYCIIAVIAFMVTNGSAAPAECVPRATMRLRVSFSLPVTKGVGFTRLLPSKKRLVSLPFSTARGLCAFRSRRLFYRNQATSTRALNRRRPSQLPLLTHSLSLLEPHPRSSCPAAKTCIYLFRRAIRSRL